MLVGIRNILKYIRILFIRTKLHIIRRSRVIKVICPRTDLLLYLMIIVLWVFYAYVIFYIGRIYDGNKETFLRTIWDLKNSIFSSVVLAFAIGAFNHLKEYRKTIKKQHYLYVDTMEDFEEIFKAISEEETWIHFHPLYNEKCFQISMEYLQTLIDRKNIEEKRFVLAVGAIEDRLDKLEIRLKDATLLVKNEEDLYASISYSKKLITTILVEDRMDLIKTLLKSLFYILENLRFIWRRDIKNDIKLMQLRGGMSENYYSRMWLPDFDIHMAKDYV